MSGRDSTGHHRAGVNLPRYWTHPLRRGSTVLLYMWGEGQGQNGPKSEEEKLRTNSSVLTLFLSVCTQELERQQREEEKTPQGQQKQREEAQPPTLTTTTTKKWVGWSPRSICSRTTIIWSIFRSVRAHRKWGNEFPAINELTLDYSSFFLLCGVKKNKKQKIIVGGATRAANVFFYHYILRLIQTRGKKVEFTFFLLFPPKKRTKLGWQ